MTFGAKNSAKHILRAEHDCLVPRIVPKHLLRANNDFLAPKIVLESPSKGQQ